MSSDYKSNPYAELYGIICLSVIPVRKDPSDRAEITTQLLFGEVLQYIYYSEDKKWLYIKIPGDDYYGWIDPKQCMDVSKHYYEEYLSNSHPLSQDLIANIKNTLISYPILIGSTLPFFNRGMVDLGDVQVFFAGDFILPALPDNFKNFEKIACLFLKSPYLWGGKSPLGIDCSGFVQQVFKINGLQLPRDAYQQAEAGSMVDFSYHQPGDLAFFNNAFGKIIHVGIFLENNRIIHSSGEVRIDHIDHIGIYDDHKTYTHKLSIIKRVIIFNK